MIHNCGIDLDTLMYILNENNKRIFSHIQAPAYNGDIIKIGEISAPASSTLDFNLEDHSRYSRLMFKVYHMASSSSAVCDDFVIHDKDNCTNRIISEQDYPSAEYRHIVRFVVGSTQCTLSIFYNKDSTSFQVLASGRAVYVEAYAIKNSVIKKNILTEKINTWPTGVHADFTDNIFKYDFVRIVIKLKVNTMEVLTDKTFNLSEVKKYLTVNPTLSFNDGYIHFAFVLSQDGMKADIGFNSFGISIPFFELEEVIAW